MAKRGAEHYLTDDNYADDDNEKEEAGQFSAASPDVLRSRLMKKARRHGGGNDLGTPSTGTGTGGTFKGFSGFTGLAGAARPAGGISFNFGEAVPLASGNAAKSVTTSVPGLFGAFSSTAFKNDPAASLSTAASTATAAKMSTSLFSLSSSASSTAIDAAAASTSTSSLTSVNRLTTGAITGNGSGAGKLTDVMAGSSLTAVSTQSVTSNLPGISFGFTGLPAATVSSSGLFSRGVTAANSPSTAGNGAAAPETSGSSPKAMYVSIVKKLNTDFLDWITKYLAKDKCVLLSNVFEDYNQHIADLDARFPGVAETVFSAEKPSAVFSTQSASAAKSIVTISSVLQGLGTSAVTPTVSVSSLGTIASSSSTPTQHAAIPSAGTAVTTHSSTSTATTPSLFGVFSASSSAVSSTAPSTFSFTSPATSAVTSLTAPGLFAPTFGSGTGFKVPAFGSGGFGATCGFTFGESAQKPVSATAGSDGTADTADTEAEEYEPPKPESVEIKEDDALYSVKCKLFYMLDGSWQERGVGYLCLKPTDNSKTQLLIRADNNMGTILLNVLLTQNIPTARQGPANVSLTCVPNPPIKGQPSNRPIPLLIRVKTAENADELLRKLDENKK